MNIAGETMETLQKMKVAAEIDYIKSRAERERAQAHQTLKDGPSDLERIFSVDRATVPATFNIKDCTLEEATAEQMADSLIAMAAELNGCDQSKKMWMTLVIVSQT